MTERVAEFVEKTSRIRGLMATEGWDWLALSALDSVAWAAGGVRTYVNLQAPAGVLTLLYGKDRVFALTNRIEAGRLVDEEIGGLPVELVVREWPEFNESRDALVVELAGSGRLASDVPMRGAQAAGASLRRLRFALTPWEIARARELAAVTVTTLEGLARDVRPGDSEEHMAAQLRGRLGEHGVLAPVALIASDERVFKYRHPLPTGKRLERYAMLVVSASKHGLVISATRLVHFGDPPAEIRSKSRACAEVDAAFIAATVVGAQVRDVFAAGLQAYGRQGYADEWKLHHQGGAAGYASREFLGWSGSTHSVQEGQLFAWNPSITGVKSEDTILATVGGPQVLTRTGGWPELQTAAGVPRPDILVL